MQKYTYLECLGDRPENPTELPGGPPNKPYGIQESYTQHKSLGLSRVGDPSLPSVHRNTQEDREEGSERN